MRVRLGRMLAWVVVGSVGVASAANAVITTYTDRASWEAAVAGAGLVAVVEDFATDPGTNNLQLGGVDLALTGVWDPAGHQTNFGLVSAVVANFTGGDPVYGIAYDFSARSRPQTAFTTLGVRNVIGETAAFNGFLAQGDTFMGVVSTEPLDPNCGFPCSFGPEVRITGLDLVLDDLSVAIVAPTPECDDGIDNDGDGEIDGDDPGCVDAADLSERDPSLVCDDGVDNDGDGGIDYDPVTAANPGDANTMPLGTGDVGCGSPTWATENPACQNGENDDGDPFADYDGGFNGPPGSTFGGIAGGTPDAQCTQPWRDREQPSSGGTCGVGPELALLLPLLGWARRSRQRRA